jgi:uncharacterized membrane protein YccC
MKFVGWDSESLAGAARLGTTALAAFALAAALGIPNPFWAAMPVWAIAQPTRGMLLERGALRFLGTLVGAATGFALLDLAGRQPYLALVFLSFWITAMATAIPLLRGGLGYGALLSGMTAAIVVLPSLQQLDHSFSLAVSRVECTLIGVLVASLMGFVWTPPARRLAFYDSVRKLSHDTLQVVEKLFGGLTESQHLNLEQTLLQKFADIQSNALLIGAGSRRGYHGIRNVDALIAAGLEVLAAARARHARLKQEGTAVLPHPSWDALHQQLENHDPQQLRDIRAQIPHLGDRLGAALEELVRTNQTLRIDGPSAHQHRIKASLFEYLSTHRDPRLAVESGLLAGIVTGIAGAAVIFLAWPPAVLCALGMSIVSMLLGSHPTPAKIAVIVLKGACTGIGAALIYRMFFQPHATTLPLLVLSLLPFVAIGSLARMHPKTAAPALDANLVFLMASHATLAVPSSAANIWIDSVTLTAGIALTCMAFMLLPPSMRKRSRALAAVFDDIQRLVKMAKPKPQDTALMLRRVIALTRHSQPNESFTHAGHSLIAVINVAEALQRLRSIQISLDVGSHEDREISQALDEICHVRAVPLDVANHLSAKAQALKGHSAAEALTDAANAIRSCHAILRSS